MKKVRVIHDGTTNYVTVVGGRIVRPGRCSRGERSLFALTTGVVGVFGRAGQ